MRASVAGYREWAGGGQFSPLARCAAFARELGGALGIPVQEDARLMELGFGA